MKHKLFNPGRLSKEKYIKISCVVLICCQGEIHLCAEGPAQSLYKSFILRASARSRQRQPLYFLRHMYRFCFCEKTMEVCNWLWWQQNCDIFKTFSFVFFPQYCLRSSWFKPSFFFSPQADSAGEPY